MAAAAPSREDPWAWARAWARSSSSAAASRSPAAPRARRATASSRAAQPDGYPDRIEWTPSEVDAVLAGRADYSGHWKPPDGDRGDGAQETHPDKAIVIR